MAKHVDSEEVTMRVKRQDLECSICLEKLNRPRSLPCLHTFCEDCLTNYITRNVASSNSFVCPVCRREIFAVNQSKDRKLWAKDFPLNSFLLEMEQMPSSSKEKRSSICIPCKKRGIEMGAVYWCGDMKSAFCEECKVNYHDMLHNGCDLTTADSDKPTKTQFEMCKRHDIPMDFFCEDHRSLYCSTCVALMHRHCVSVQPASVYCQTLRTGPALTDMKSSIQKALRAMNIIVDGSNDQMQDLDLRKNTAIKEIRDLRNEIDAYLNDLQTAMEQEVVQTHRQEHGNLEECLRSYTSLKNDVMELENAFVSRQFMEGDRQTILLYQQGKTVVEQCCQMVNKVKRQRTARTKEHKVDFDPSKLKNHFSLGKIVTSTITRTLPIKDNLELLFSHLRVVRESTFKIQLPWEVDCCATGVLYMSDGRLVVADHHNKSIKMFTEDGRCVHYLLLEHAPWGICHHSEGLVAISMMDCSLITVVKIGANTLEILYEVDTQTRGNIYGISYLNGTFFITSDVPQLPKSANLTDYIHPKNIKRRPVLGCYYSLYSVKSDASTNSVLPLENSSFYIVYDHLRKDFILSSTNKSSSNIAVCRSSPQGQVQEVANAETLKGTHGIDIDRDGNIYACGKSSHNIVQMSATGKRVRELLTAADGIRYPLDISVLDHRFAVTFDSCDRRNHVYIYHMEV